MRKPGGRAGSAKVKTCNGLAPSGGATMVKCMRCGEQGHGHWTCFGKVHESRLWGRDPKRRRKRLRRTDMNVKIMSGMKETPLVVNGVVQGYGGGKRSSGDNEEAAVSLKRVERRGVSADGKSVELEKVAPRGGTADRERGNGKGYLQHITDQGGCVGNVV